MFAVLLLFAGHGAYVARGLARGSATMAQRGQAEILWPLVQWAASHAKPGDVVASNAPVMIALYTGLTTVPISILTPAEYLVDKTPPVMAAELGALYDRYRPSLLVLVRGTAEHNAVPVWAAQPGAPARHRLPTNAGGRLGVRPARAMTAPDTYIPCSRRRLANDAHPGEEGR